MDIKSFNKKLTKISALTESSNEDAHISALERDLLLSYIRDLYDLVLENSTDKLPKNHDRQNEVKVTEPVYKEKLEEDRSQVEEMKPIVIEEPAATSKEMSVETKVKEPLIVVDKQIKPISNQIDKELFAELFAEEKVTDLSDKLALSPVKDLTKSMGINERIFTQQELFGNNQQVFGETLQRLNNFQNFDEAKQYLLDTVIISYNWTHESKIKKAATFIKLVKRKFS